MRHGVDRRMFFRSALALGCLPLAGAARAAEAVGTGTTATGKVIFGLYPDNALSPVLHAVLNQLRLQANYEPDLGARPVYMPGNAGALALDAVNKGPRDGSTVLLASSATMTLQPHLRKLPTVDPVADFVPTAALFEYTVALAVGPAVPDSVRTMKDYLGWVRANPTQANCAVPGLGSASHFIASALGRAADVPIKPAAYKSLVSLDEDLVDGNVPAAVSIISSLVTAARQPQVRLLAVASDQRWPGQPAVPTLRELGLVDTVIIDSGGFHLGTGTPEARVEALGRAVRQATASAAVRAAVAAAGMRSVATDAPEYAVTLAQQRAAWGDIVRQQRFSIES